MLNTCMQLNESTLGLNYDWLTYYEILYTIGCASDLKGV